MSVKIRLQRHGKKQKPFYWIVAADARSKRDGRYLEKLGTYNPNTNPATIDLNLDQAVQWLHNGAQPTDTARAILSYKGALMKHHLDGGVRKGALTQEQADAKLAKWLEEKAGKVDTKKEGLSKAQEAAKAKALKAEKVANDKRAAAAVEAAKVVEEEVAEETAVEAVADEAPEAVTEVAVEETPEVVAEEAPAAEETVAEVTVEETPEVVAEVATEEAPAAEEASEETEA
ncbi:30S ribosomal protein S16 [Flavobacterium paronense]|uniref:Small ribosomal subunit protein bS16 n=1 Tax=Flavobacterium paronense TaxID=1392775 RepID=A0ABV5GDZ2_9FLAO|nr:30S ribosomal protein S16 [Flavobacterium paronense]MDN3678134.1 30S ribosomal protein S16 [Flavobacterium paronense]